MNRRARPRIGWLGRRFVDQDVSPPGFPSESADLHVLRQEGLPAPALTAACPPAQTAVVGAMWAVTFGPRARAGRARVDPLAEELPSPPPPHTQRCGSSWRRLAKPLRRTTYIAALHVLGRCSPTAAATATGWPSRAQRERRLSEERSNEGSAWPLSACRSFSDLPVPCGYSHCAPSTLPGLWRWER
jgi:hypothetical protein